MDVDTIGFDQVDWLLLSSLSLLLLLLMLAVVVWLWYCGGGVVVG